MLCCVSKLCRKNRKLVFTLAILLYFVSFNPNSLLYHVLCLQALSRGFTFSAFLPWLGNGESHTESQDQRYYTYNQHHHPQYISSASLSTIPSSASSSTIHIISIIIHNTYHQHHHPKNIFTIISINVVSNHYDQQWPGYAAELPMIAENFNPEKNRHVDEKRKVSKHMRR